MISSPEILHAKLLVVDDQQAMILLLEQVLRRAGYLSITTTRNPREVRELHAKNRYDLILLDIQMPGTDGFKVMEDLKQVETSGRLPVLAMTAQPSHEAQALAAGARDFICKPFDLGVFRTRVHSMLEVSLLAAAALT
jgi:DNA-binding response OmpR family regulator